MVKLKLQLFAYSGNSIVDYLNSEGQDSSFSARKKLASDVGISNYTGTASQNAQLLNSLRGGSSSATSTGANTGTTAAKTAINGVDQSIADKAYNSTFTTSDEVSSLKDKADSAAARLEGIASDTSIVDTKTMNTINSSYSPSNAYTQAMKYTNELLKKLSSGKTSYTDQIQALMSEIQNREDFVYDADSDQLFQQALASAMNSGKTAMQDTIGQASALTGGYGSTYATSAGNQAYNAFIEDAYNNLPEYYQMALQAYQMEGDEMYKELGMLTDADATEYQRTYDAWSANFANAESLYNREYGQYRDEKSDAYNSANLQINERNTLFGEASTMFDVYSSQENTQYNREYQKWADEVTQAQNYASMLNSDWWNKTNFDENVRQFNETMAYNKSKGSGGSGGGSGGSSLSSGLLKTLKEVYVDAGGGESGLLAVDEFLNGTGNNNLSSEDMYYLESELSRVDVPIYNQNWTISKDTTNWFGGSDKNDIYSNGTTTMTYKQLEQEIRGSGLSEKEQEKILNKLKSQSKK